MTEVYGEVVAVETRRAETQLVGAHASGVAVLNVLDVSGIPASGTVLVGAQVLAYTGTADQSFGAASDTIILAAPTTVAYLDLTPVVLTPERPYRLALVVPTGSSIAEEALVSHPMYDRLPEGIRTPGAGEIAHLTWRDQAWLLDGLLGVAPVVDGGFLDPTAPITPGAITTSYQQSPDEFSNSLPAEFIGDGAVTAQVSVDGAIVLRNAAGGEVRMDPYGIFTKEPDGSPRTSLPNAPGQSDVFRGDVEADELDVAGTLTAQTSVQMRGGAVLRLGAGAGSPMPAPTVSPTVQPLYFSTPVAFPSWSVASQRRGLALKSATEAYCLEISSGPTFMHVFSPQDGTYAGSWNFYGRPGGLVRLTSIGYIPTTNQIVTLEYDLNTDLWWVRYWSFDGVTGPTFVSQTAWAVVGAAVGSPYPQPGFTVVQATSNIYIARADAQTGLVTSWRYDAAMNLIATTVTDLVLPAGQRDIAGVTNAAGSLFIVTRATGGVVYDVDQASGLTVTTYPSANGDAAAAGFTRSYSVTGATGATRQLSGTSNLLYTYPPFHEADVWWVAASYADSATGHETTPGPATQVTRIKGTSSIFAVGSIPAGANSVFFYAGPGATPPPPTGMFRQLPAVGSPADPRAQLSVSLLGANPDGFHPNPLTVGTLMSVGAPAVLAQADGTALIRGDGTGRIFDLIAAGGGGGGGGGTGGVDIDCGTFGGTGVDIDCGGFV